MGGFFTSRGYRLAKTRPPSSRALRDEVLVGEVRRVFEENYRVYGVRKLWHAMRREGWDIGRDQVGRLMKIAGINGVRRGRSPVTTRPSNTPDTRPDLVKRVFKTVGPNRLWVADITYVRTIVGFVYTAFITDVYTRKIVGWAVRSTMKTEALPLEALEQAITCAKADVSGLIHHCDHGSQYLSIAYTDRLVEAGIRLSTGTVGDSYDNALAETVNGLYKTELIYSRRWESLMEVEFATMNWVHWWNNQRLHENLGYKTPTETENNYYAEQAARLTPV